MPSICNDFGLCIFFSSEPGSPNAPIAAPVRPFHFTTTGEKPKPLTPADKSKLVHMALFAS
jgi:hypothetical protein